MKLTMGLDPESITKAIKKLEEYRDKGLQKKIDRTIGDVANRIIEVANDRYSTTYRTSEHMDLSPSVSFTITRPNKKDWYITAFTLDPHARISFLEFGTGAPTDTGHPYADKVPYPVEPGSWSATHANTWERMVVRGGMAPRDYPYNHEPKRGLFHGMEAGRRYLHNMQTRSSHIT